MTEQPRIRRCAHLYLEKREQLMFDPIRLLQGGDGLVAQDEYVALLPQRGKEVSLTRDEAHALDEVGLTAWRTQDEVAQAIGAERMQALLDKGVLVREGSPDGERDQWMRDAWWHPLGAIGHSFSRWSNNDAEAARRAVRFETVANMVAECGPPPTHFFRREDAIRRVALQAPQRTAMDELMARRVTCRNFDVSKTLPSQTLATMLKRIFGVQASEEMAPGAIALKKNHPSGGALHPIEAYLIVQRVEGLAPGLYHYNVEAHALDLLREVPAEELRAFALTAVAGQEYFADAPVLVAMAARFARSMWKYRHHPKIYRAILLEVGHISQNIYLSATEFGLGAFITAAVNEVQIEEALGLDPMQQGPLCVSGFGERTAHKNTVEFDPLGKVWNETARA